jgi:CMP-N,N'-diacetyllegionaminic acid synthase
MTMEKVLAVIPARGGSKGVPNKNVRLVAGKPLIGFSIETAQQSPSIDRIIVSTDSPEIAAIAKECGVEVPFLRPGELARDDTPGIAPVLHALEWLSTAEGYRPDLIVLLQPTSPFRPAGLIDESIALMRAQKCDVVLSLTPARKHPYWMKTVSNSLIYPLLPAAQIPTRRQDLPPAYAVSGSLYLWTRSALLRRTGANCSGATQFPDERVGAVFVDGLHAVDIDTELDLRVANALAPELLPGVSNL